jgi:hypothetical protein
MAQPNADLAVHIAARAGLATGDPAIDAALRALV